MCSHPLTPFFNQQGPTATDAKQAAAARLVELLLTQEEVPLEALSALSGQKRRRKAGWGSGL